MDVEEEFKSIESTPHSMEATSSPATTIPTSGYLYTWGKNSAGCLANKTEDKYENTPYKVDTKTRFTSVSTGGFFGIAVSADGRLYAWGETKNSRTGHPSSHAQILLPKCIPNIDRIASVSCGNWHSLALSIDQKVFATGHNKYGACGIQNQDEVVGFKQIELNFPIAKISAGDGFSLFIDRDDCILSCGFRLKHGNAADAHQTSVKPIKDLIGIKIHSISAGFAHAACVGKSEGEVYTWGAGDFLQLGHGNAKSLKTPVRIPELSGIESVSCSRGEKYCHTMAKSVSGEVYTWGSGYKGKLGHDQVWTHKDPADESRPRKIQGLSGVQEVIAGGIHSAVLRNDHKAMTFGCGSDGRLGHPEEAKYVYLYREPAPRVIEGPFGVAGNQVLQVVSSYYFMAAIALN